MRIMVSGTHRVGKTTLVQALDEAWAQAHDVIDEPYAALVEDGHEFTDPPTVEDYEALLQAAIDTVNRERAVYAIFDRGPLDYLAYLLALDPDYDVEPWKQPITDAMATISIIAQVPIERAIAVSTSEDLQLRAQVAERLESILDDYIAIWSRVVDVSGSVDARVQQVLAEFDEF